VQIRERLFNAQRLTEKASREAQILLSISLSYRFFLVFNCFQIGLPFVSRIFFSQNFQRCSDLNIFHSNLSCLFLDLRRVNEIIVMKHVWLIPVSKSTFEFWALNICPTLEAIPEFTSCTWHSANSRVALDCRHNMLRNSTKLNHGRAKFVKWVSCFQKFFAINESLISGRACVPRGQLYNSNLRRDKRFSPITIETLTRYSLQSL